MKPPTPLQLAKRLEELASREEGVTGDAWPPEDLAVLRSAASLLRLLSGKMAEWQASALRARASRSETRAVAFPGRDEPH